MKLFILWIHVCNKYEIFTSICLQSTSPTLPPGLAKVIAHSIFQDVHCQSQLQMDRRKIYKTIKNLLTFKLEGIANYCYC